MASTARWRDMLALVRPYRRRLVVALGCLVISSGLGLVFPQVVRQVIDAAVGGGERSMLDQAVIGLLLVFVIQSIASFFRAYLFTWLGERVVLDLRARLYRAMVAQEIGFFDQSRTGELVSRLASDATVVQNTVTANVSMALRFGMQLLGGLGMLIWSSPSLSLIILATTPLLAIEVLTLGRKVRQASTDVQDRLADASTVVEESLAGIRSVKAAGAEGWEAQRYGAAIERSFRTALRRSVASSGLFAISSMTLLVGIAGVLWVGGQRVLAGAMSAGELTAFVLYTFIIAFSLGALSSLWADIQKAIGASARIFDILEREPLLPRTTSPTPIPNGPATLRFEEVGFHYPARPEVPVLQSVDLEVPGGSVVALVGRSGAGKSTMMALLMRFYDPSAGRVTLDGADLRDLALDDLRAGIGLVSQDPVIFSTSLRENIAYGRPHASEAEIQAAATAARVDEFLDRLPEGFATPLGERGVQLSGGQRQRVAIARAILRDPRILLLDEATSSLDSHNEALVQEALEALMKGRTTLVIAHRLSTIVDADQVVVMEGGRIVEQGTHQGLLSRSGAYQALYRRQHAS